jgi:hypothetical protein
MKTIAKEKDHVVEEMPVWVNTALHGVTYWIGHRRCIWPRYPLSEAALVAEMCNLIATRLIPPFSLECEVPYKKLLGGAKLANSGDNARADLVVFQQLDSGRKAPRYVIEVKRVGPGGAPKTLINSDLKRLVEVRSKLKGVRALLLGVSELGTPCDFINEEGKAVVGPHEIPGGGYYRVRRVLKAADSFSEVENAHYGCAVEVYD